MCSEQAYSTTFDKTSTPRMHVIRVWRTWHQCWPTQFWWPTTLREFLPSSTLEEAKASSWKRFCSSIRTLEVRFSTRLRQSKGQSDNAATTHGAGDARTLPGISSPRFHKEQTLTFCVG